MAVTETDIAEIVNDQLSAVISGDITVDEVVASYPDIAELLRTELETAIWLYRQNLSIELPQDLFNLKKGNLLNRLPKRHPVPVSGSLARSPRIPRWTRLGLLAAIFLICFSLTGVVVASQAALPGYPLYSLKLNLETWRLAVSRDESQKADIQFQIAEARLSEIEVLVKDGEAGMIAAEIERYVSSLLSAISGVEPDDEPDLRKQELALKFERKLVEHVERLEALRDQLPENAQHGINRAIMVSVHGLSVAKNAVQGIHLPINSPGMKPTRTITPTATVTQTLIHTPTRTIKAANTHKPSTSHPDKPSDPQPALTKTPPGLLLTPPAHGLDKTKPAAPTHPNPKEDPKPTKTPKD